MISGSHIRKFRKKTKTSTEIEDELGGEINRIYNEDLDRDDNFEST